MWVLVSISFKRYNLLDTCHPVLISLSAILLYKYSKIRWLQSPIPHSWLTRRNNRLILPTHTTWINDITQKVNPTLAYTVLDLVTRTKTVTTRTSTLITSRPVSFARDQIVVPGSIQPRRIKRIKSAIQGEENSMDSNMILLTSKVS